MTGTRSVVRHGRPDDSGRASVPGDHIRCICANEAFDVCLARARVPYTRGPARARHGDEEGTIQMGVFIIREMVGTSPRSWSDAARQAVATAARTVRNIREIEVVKSTATVVDGQISEYRVELKIHFEYEAGS